jgi:hypothetical protein
MKYAIQYEHLKDELAKNSKLGWHFNKVKDSANEFSLELSDEDFKRFFQLHAADIDITWLMHKMSSYKLSLTDALIGYIIY